MRWTLDDGVLFASKLPRSNSTEMYTYQPGVMRHSSKHMGSARPSTREGTRPVVHTFVSIIIFTSKNVKKETYR